MYVLSSVVDSSYSMKFLYSLYWHLLAKNWMNQHDHFHLCLSSYTVYTELIAWLALSSAFNPTEIRVDNLDEYKAVEKMMQSKKIMKFFQVNWCSMAH